MKTITKQALTILHEAKKVKKTNRNLGIFLDLKTKKLGTYMIGWEHEDLGENDLIIFDGYYIEQSRLENYLSLINNDGTFGKEHFKTLCEYEDFIFTQLEEA